MDRPTMDVVAIQVRLEDEHANVGQRAEVDKLLDLMLEESLVDQRYEQELCKCCQTYELTVELNEMHDKHYSEVYQVA